MAITLRFAPPWPLVTPWLLPSDLSEGLHASLAAGPGQALPAARVQAVIIQAGCGADPKEAIHMGRDHVDDATARPAARPVLSNTATRPAAT